MPEPLSILNWDPEEDERERAAEAASQIQPTPPPAVPAPAQVHADPIPEQRPAGSPVKLILGLLGALLLVGGVFAPLMSVPIVGNVSYIYNGRGDGIIVLALGVVALFLVVLKLYKALPLVGALTLLVLGFTYFNVQSRIAELQENMNRELAGNPFRGLGEAMMAAVQMQWGWGVLLVGALLLILTPLIRE